MANYVVTTDFAPKDALPTGNPSKVASGTQVATEFNNIATAIATKEDTANKGALNGYASLDGSGDVPDTQIPATIPRLANANTFTNNTTISSTDPRLITTETDAATDEKNWIIRASAGVWTLSTSTDAAPTTASANAITIDRTGTAVTNLNLLGTSVTINSNTIWHAGNDGTGSGLDADLLDGRNSDTAGSADTIVLRNGSGDGTFRYLISGSTNSENPTVAQLMVTNGTDNIVRKASLAHVKTALALPKQAWAAVSSGGTINGTHSSSGITSVSRTTTGQFTVDYTAAGFSTIPVIQATVYGALGYATIIGQTATSCTVWTGGGNVDTGTGAPTFADRSFMFSAVGS